MDRRGIKRPRSETSTGRSTTTDGSTSRKPQQKKKGGNKNSGGVSFQSPSSEPTATPEGMQMSQALSTFNPTELSRFEAFRRCSFQGNALSKYISFRLLEEDERRYAKRLNTQNLLHAPPLRKAPVSSHASAKKLNTAPFVKKDGVDAEEEVEIPPLKELVAPNSAQEITIVVSTLAKAYAQRLVSAARRVASSQGYKEEDKLLPKHFREAYAHRMEAGIDPGFLFNGGSGSGSLAQTPPVSSSVSAAALGVVDPYRLKMEAVMAVQDAYDRQVKAGEGAEGGGKAVQEDVDAAATAQEGKETAAS